MLSIAVISTYLVIINAWNTIPQTSITPITRSGPLLSTVDDTVSTTTEASLRKLQRDRYIATNRFSVRKGKEAKFENRWAIRKSRLATLEGFRYFHLMKRVNLKDDTTSYYSGHEDDNSSGNYVSFTIWKEKKHFSAWRKGDAFKEAHGGTSIVSFMSTMINSALVLNGPPRPAFYDGLLLQSVPPTYVPETEDGWRKVSHDFDKSVLPAECFIACNQFFVPEESSAAFEERWAGRTSVLKDCDGFVSFNLLRRDGSSKGHGTVPMDSSEPSYVSTTIWKDYASFEAWKSGDAFKASHGQKDEKPVPPPVPLWSKPPVPIFYEGTLVISNEEGA